MAWWLWAVGLATAASRTTNPLLLALVLAVARPRGRRPAQDAPWARAFQYYLVLGARRHRAPGRVPVVFGAARAGRARPVHAADLPAARTGTAGVRLGGPVAVEGDPRPPSYDGLRLATLLCCIGAANALANPKRVLRVLPGALYELGVAVVGRADRRAAAGRERPAGAPRPAAARPGPARDCAGCAAIAVPVLEDALGPVAAARRGDGLARLRPASATAAPAAAAATAALHARRPGSACASGAYGAARRRRPRAGSGPPLLGGGVAAVRRRARASAAAGSPARRYRPDPWRAPEWLVAGCGVVARRSSVVRRPGQRTRPPSYPASPAAPGPRCRCAAGRRRPLAGPRRRSLAPPPPARGAGRAGRRAAAAAASSRRVARVIRFDRVTSPTPAPPRRRCATSTSRSTRASCAWSSAAPGRASRRCSARSTGSCRTSPAARWPGGVRSTAGTPRTHPPRELADVVGVVGQDPLAGFVTDTVEEELAYGMEQLALPPAVMRKRVEETLDLLGLADLRDRPLHDALRAASSSGSRSARCSPPTRGCSCSTSRPRRSTRPPPRRCSPRITRLVHDLGRHRGAGRAPARTGACSTPTGSSLVRRRRHGRSR